MKVKVTISPLVEKELRRWGKPTLTFDWNGGKKMFGLVEVAGTIFITVKLPLEYQGEISFSDWSETINDNFRYYTLPIKPIPLCECVPFPTHFPPVEPVVNTIIDKIQYGEIEVKLSKDDPPREVTVHWFAEVDDTIPFPKRNTLSDWLIWFILFSWEEEEPYSSLAKEIVKLLRQDKVNVVIPSRTSKDNKKSR